MPATRVTLGASLRSFRNKVAQRSVMASYRSLCTSDDQSRYVKRNSGIELEARRDNVSLAVANNNAADARLSLLPPPLREIGPRLAAVIRDSTPDWALARVRNAAETSAERADRSRRRAAFDRRDESMAAEARLNSLDGVAVYLCTT